MTPNGRYHHECECDRESVQHLVHGAIDLGFPPEKTCVYLLARYM